LLAGVAGGLWLLGVRDWRCYVLALSTFPVLHGAVFGNATLLLVPTAALAWTFRDRALAVAAAVGFAVALKLFLWPLGVWLLATRRYRAAAGAVAAAAALVLGSWAVIGFAGLREYPDLLGALTDVFAAHSTSVYATAMAVGVPDSAAAPLSFVLGGAVLATGFVLSRRGDRDRRLFSGAIVASLLFSPIVWPHYFALLVVPIVLLSPRLSWAWLAMPAFWVVSYGVPVSKFHVDVNRPVSVPEAIWDPLHSATLPIPQMLGYTALLAAITVVCLRRRGEAL
jgi:hypothetical protein